MCNFDQKISGSDCIHSRVNLKGFSLIFIWLKFFKSNLINFCLALYCVKSIILYGEP